MASKSEAAVCFWRQLLKPADPYNVLSSHALEGYLSYFFKYQSSSLYPFASRKKGCTFFCTNYSLWERLFHLISICNSFQSQSNFSFRGVVNRGVEAWSRSFAKRIFCPKMLRVFITQHRKAILLLLSSSMLKLKISLCPICIIKLSIRGLKNNL